MSYSLNKPIPERIREARKARGLSIADLAAEVGVSRQAISQYELGQSVPSGQTMAKICDVLRFPLSFYLRPIVQSNGASSAIFYRSLKQASRTHRDMFEVRTDWIEDIYQYLEQYVRFPELKIPNLSDFLSHESEELSGYEIDEIAVHVRKEWGLGLGPISNIILLVEKNGFIVARNSLKEADKIDACSRWKSGRPFIFLGASDSTAVRIRFDVAHELGHLLLHSDVEPEQLMNKEIRDKIEREAHRFASAFLLPRDTFIQEIMSTSLEHFKQLKRRWRVSIAAMIYRCTDLKLLTENQVLYLRKQLSRAGRKREPLDDIIVPESPKVFKQAFDLLIDNEIVSPHEVLDALPFGETELELLANLEPGSLNTQSKVIPISIKTRRL